MNKLLFRAWDKTCNKMVDFLDFKVIFYTNRNIFRISSVRDYNIMLYIGLTDKHGNNIFEGDILKIDSTQIGGKVVIGEVVFNTDQTLSGLEYGLWTENGYHRTDFLGELEVLGNVYESGKDKL